MNGPVELALEQRKGLWRTEEGTKSYFYFLLTATVQNNPDVMSPHHIDLRALVLPPILEVSQRDYSNVKN